MPDELLQEDLLKRDKKAASFVTIGEPDVLLKPFHHKDTETQRKSARGNSENLCASVVPD
jgi:hypothetical protein